jgi:hypothetical protein
MVESRLFIALQRSLLHLRGNYGQRVLRWIRFEKYWQPCS